MVQDEYLKRLILEFREAIHRTGLVVVGDIPPYSKDEICYHAELLHADGLLLDYNDVRSGDGAVERRLLCRIGPLTAAGQKELKRIRDERP